MKIHELLTGPDKWTKGADARTVSKMCYVSPHDVYAGCWCLRGAMIRCYGNFTNEFYEVQKKIQNEIRTEKPHSITEWNDDKERTFEEVLALCKKLDI